MFSRPRRQTLVALGAMALAGAARGQGPTPAPTPRKRKPLPSGLTGGPPRVEADIVTVDIEATTTEARPEAASGSGEAAWLIERLRNAVKLSSRFTLSDEVSIQEVLSTDFLLPEGSKVYHKRGEATFLLADPAAKTYYPMGTASLMAALEGGAGIVNSQYDARVEHSDEKQKLVGLECRRSTVRVSYASAVPLENDTVYVQRRVEMTVWHTHEIPSSAFVEHVFFQYQSDAAQRVKNTLLSELGFPMQLDFVLTREGAKGRKEEPGSFRLKVREAQVQVALDPELFKLPPAGFRRLDRNPYLKR